MTTSRCLIRPLEEEGEKRTISERAMVSANSPARVPERRGHLQEELLIAVALMVKLGAELQDFRVKLQTQYTHV